ncbi:PAS/PAC sensor signal transduction histidine kinase [Candidatus Nitrosopumilus koreensis AR1]|uniref:histidine kinase n=2 Tax=Nitrosopumilaceae TaxID=338190 RepID=K0B7D8_9ARCH|nr:PAS/PAC sensor signal transduction histidine kinase [Candidatus Nitrosopumilus koreensis AR1]
MQNSKINLETLEFCLNEAVLLTVWDKHGTITYANKKFCDVSGYEEKELIGQNHRILKAKTYSDQFYDELWNVISNGKTWHGEIKNVSKTGKYYWVMATIVPVFDEDGKPEQYVAIRTDITNRKNIEERLRRSQSDVEKIKFALDESALVAITDKQGTITYANKKFCDVSGYEEKELIGQNHRILKSGYHPPEFYDELWEVISKGKTWQGEIKNVSKTGKYYWVKTTIVPFLDEDGKPEQYVAIRTDITDRKEAEERLLKANKTILENEKQIKEQIEKLKLHDKMQTEFINVAAHELRTPIQPLRNYTQLALNGLVDSKTALEIIDSESDRLRNLANDILDASRIESGTLAVTFSRTMINDIIYKTTDMIKRDLENNIKIETELKDTNELIIDADHDRLMQVFTNIISNACRFAKTKIWIKSKTIDSENIKIEIRDDGDGISDEILHSLFEKFVTKSANMSDKKGTGLGLFISKNIIESHHGTISAGNLKTEGAQFTITLPIKQKIIKTI